MSQVVKNVFHMFGAIGGGALGFKRASVRMGLAEGRWQCLGSVDIDERANREFSRRIGAPATTMDLMDRSQYVAYHGHEPPAGWREATPDDIRRAAQGQHPHCVFLSSPCKGLSGLLSEAKSKTDKYQALNRLTVRGVWLMLEAWADDPPEMVLFENVPRIANRGRHLLDQIIALLHRYGYATNETTHDCGELAELAQSRKRFLLVARHAAKVPALLYEPPRRPLRAVGDVLGKMLLPGDLRAGPMHRVPNLQWKTWVRLAFVEAGSDWRSLNKLAVEDGKLRDFLLVPEDPQAWHPNVLGVNEWDRPSGTVTSEARPTTGRFAVADPRAFSSREGSGFLGVREWDGPAGTVTANGRPGAGAFSVADPRVGQSANWNHGQQYGVHEWTEPTGAVTAQQWPNQGRFAVADPRFDSNGNDFSQYGVMRWDRPIGAVINVKSPGQGPYTVQDPRCGATKHNNCFRVVRFDQAAGTVTGGGHPSAGGQAVADPRPAASGRLFTKYPVTEWKDHAGTVIGGDDTGAYAVADPRNHGQDFSKYPVTGWDQASGSVIAGSTTGQGAFAVADPRSGLDAERGSYLTGGHYGVLPWNQPSGAVSSSAGYDNGRWSVADPRMPEPSDKVVAMIRALDNTWHRPFTTLELAALQSLFDPEDPEDMAAFYFDGKNDSLHREWIGNAVPSKAAEAMAQEILRTLMLADAGETFQLSATPVWVRPLVTALTLPGAL